ncbi:Hypothetical predicted protein [Paramuricea clavata]|uniref:Uncharacterized protein n=1 Tax=Paramuricea clavata TaxID=317549 RepID=A0A6S7HUX1_PARCT|nr:Hypothetical predicted protein [Paramuricea clavata]
MMDKLEENDDDKADNSDEDGEDSAEKKDKSSGVWHVVSQPSVPVAPVEEVKEEPKKEVVKGAYVPPSRRNATPSQADGRDQSWKYRTGRERDPRRPPEISSEIAFPTLQASTASDKR